MLHLRPLCLSRTLQRVDPFTVAPADTGTWECYSFGNGLKIRNFLHTSHSLLNFKTSISHLKPNFKYYPKFLSKTVLPFTVISCNLPDFISPLHSKNSVFAFSGQVWTQFEISIWFIFVFSPIPIIGSKQIFSLRTSPLIERLFISSFEPISISGP